MRRRAGLWPELRLKLSQADSPTLSLYSPGLSWQQGLLQLQPGHLELAGERLDLQQAEATTEGAWALRLGGAARLAPWLNLLGQTQSGPTSWSGAARLRLAIDLHGAAHSPAPGPTEPERVAGRAQSGRTGPGPAGA